MGKAQSKNDEEKGITEAQVLDSWRNVIVKIGVAGDTGVGKSSFINAFRGLDDEDENAATTCCLEAISKPVEYPYPGNPNIILVDLPGIGTRYFPDLDTYCDKVDLEMYDTFLILTAGRFRQNYLDLARKIKSMEKSFFLVRTKIDQDESNEKREKNFDIEAMLRRIRADCYKNTKDLEIREDEIFLISNYDKDQWDFNRLVLAILDKLSIQQQKALTLSLANLSKDVLIRKVKILQEKAPSKNDNGKGDDEELQRARRLIEEKGVTGAQDLMREKLDGWKDVKVKIGVTGNAGVGKSSFINAFRGLDDEDEGAAATDYVEATSEPAPYPYPGNLNIILMDLPGIGTPNFPDLDTYCDKVDLETYDTFLILTAGRFRQTDLDLAQKVKSMEKSFFLVRTKIDNDERSVKRGKKPDIEAMLKRIRADCYKNTKDLEIREDEIFLVSNHDKDQSDFDRLTQAILDKLPTHQQEALILSLKNLSKNVLRRKVEIFRDQLWWISYLLFLTNTINLVVIPFNVVFTYLGFPELDSEEFKRMKPEFQERMRKLYPKKEDKGFWKQVFAIFTKRLNLFSREQTPFKVVQNSLNHFLDDMLQLSLDLMDDAAIRMKDEIEHAQ